MPAILDPAFVLRCVAGLLVGLALLSGGQVFFEKRYPKRPPLWAVPVLVLPMLLAFIAAFMLASSAGSWIVNAVLPQNVMAAMTGALVAGGAGVLGVALLNQVLCNVWRKRAGLKTHKVEIWRK